MSKPIISPSILSANFLNIQADIEALNRSEADWVHVDVMDGVFVPNISIGFPLVKQVAEISKKPLDVHLMIVQPEKFIKELKDMGAMMMNVHYETCTHLHRVIQQIKDAGMKAGVTLNPSTPVAMLKDIITDVDMVLLMSVNPGFGGQKFINIVPKLERLMAMCNEQGVSPLIQVDGGVDAGTCQLCKENGAEVLVAGSAYFKATDRAAFVKTIQA